MRRLGEIRWFSANRGYGLISALDGTGELLVYGNDIEAGLESDEDGVVAPEKGRLVQYRERFHTALRLAMTVRLLPKNVVAFKRRAEGA